MDCMMAVRKDWGLKKPASHTVVGNAKSVVQASSSWRGRGGAELEPPCPHTAVGSGPPPPARVPLAGRGALSVRGSSLKGCCSLPWPPPGGGRPNGCFWSLLDLLGGPLHLWPQELLTPRAHPGLPSRGSACTLRPVSLRCGPGAFGPALTKAGPAGTSAHSCSPALPFRPWGWVC